MTAAAREAAAATTSGTLTATMHHVGITVVDLDAVCDWYASAFDMAVEFAFEVEEIGMRGAVLRAPSGFGIELIARAGVRTGGRFTGPADAALIGGHSHVAIQVDNLPAVHAQLLGRGATERMVPQQSPQPGWRMSFVADPEGNLIELVEPIGTADPVH